MFEKNDPGLALDAIKAVLQAQNVTALAEITGLRRDNLYRTFRGKADPLFSRILNLFAGLDIRFAVEPLPAKKKPPRPQLGRPPSRTKNEKSKRQLADERSAKALVRSNK